MHAAAPLKPHHFGSCEVGMEVGKPVNVDATAAGKVRAPYRLTREKWVMMPTARGTKSNERCVSRKSAHTDKGGPASSGRMPIGSKTVRINALEKGRKKGGEKPCENSSSLIEKSVSRPSFMGRSSSQRFHGPTKRSPCGHSFTALAAPHSAWSMSLKKARRPDWSGLELKATTHA